MNRPLQSFVDEVLDGFEYYKFGAFKTILDEDENLTRIDMKETEQIIHFLFEECIITLKDVNMMSLDSKLRQIAVDNHHSNSVITMEYITYLKMYAKFYGKQYMGRESRLKLKAYKSVRENYE